MVEAGRRILAAAACARTRRRHPDLRINELEIADAWCSSREGDPAQVLAYDAFLEANQAHWLVARDPALLEAGAEAHRLTSRSLVALVEPGSCFAGTLAEIVFAADRSYMLIGQLKGDNRPPAGDCAHAMSISAPIRCRTASRGWSRAFSTTRAVARQRARRDRRAARCRRRPRTLGLVTFALDDIDWDDEIRMFLEERASFSPDGLTGLEANLRFGGPETMESKIFARLTAWQNWIFQRPNAVGEEGALRRYGTGQKPLFDMTRLRANSECE